LGTELPENLMQTIDEKMEEDAKKAEKEL